MTVSSRLLMGTTIVALVSACTSPVKMRIQTTAPTLLSKNATYVVSMPEGVALPFQEEAERLLETRLARFDLSRTVDEVNAKYSASLAIAVRPVQLTYTVGDIRTETKRKRLFQSCDDQEYLVNIILTHIVDGSVAYRGRAAEYRCKVELTEVLPELLDAALSGFEGKVGARIKAHP